MNRDEFIKQIQKDFKINDIDKVMAKIDKYINLLNEYNQKFNLTRLNKDNIIYSEYFYESLIPYIGVDFKNFENVLDIGSGSGIPGIVLKILYDNIHLTIIESNSKKCNFLTLLVKEINLSNVNIVNKRVEECKTIYEEYFDLITCRAVASLKILIEICFPLAKLNSKLIFGKSINYLNELKDASWIINQLDANNYKINKWIFNNKEFNTFVFVKTTKSNSSFPRAWKEIIK